MKISGVRIDEVRRVGDNDDYGGYGGYTYEFGTGEPTGQCHIHVIIIIL